MRRETSRGPSEIKLAKIHIWADSQVTIKKIYHTDPGPGQWLARRIIGRAQLLVERRK